MCSVYYFLSSPVSSTCRHLEIPLSSCQYLSSVVYRSLTTRPVRQYYWVTRNNPCLIVLMSRKHLVQIDDSTCSYNNKLNKCTYFWRQPGRIIFTGNHKFFSENKSQELILLARLGFFLKISSVLNQGFGQNNWLGLICQLLCILRKAIIVVDTNSFFF